MEVEEHIVEEYFRRKGYSTISGIRLEGNREIDLLALNRPLNKFLHTEISVRIGYPFQLLDRAHKFDIINYPKKKFEDSRVVEYIKNFFGTQEYEKVIVIWDKPDKDWNKIKESAVKQRNNYLIFEGHAQGIIRGAKARQQKSKGRNN